MAQKGFMESQTDLQKMTYKFAMDTYQNRLLQEQFKAELANWQGFDAMYDARLKAFSLYNVMPQEGEKNVAQTMSFMHLPSVILLRVNILLSKPKIMVSGYLFSRRLHMLLLFKDRLP